MSVNLTRPYLEWTSNRSALVNVTNGFFESSHSQEHDVDLILPLRRVPGSEEGHVREGHLPTVRQLRTFSHFRTTGPDESFWNKA